MDGNTMTALGMTRWRRLRRRMHDRALLLGCGFLLAAMPPDTGAVELQRRESASETELLDLSVEELMDVEVSLVSRKPEKLATAPAAVFVITQEDIRRSGATSIPELLRMVPGIQVARMDANKWAVSARGMNGRFARFMLVQIDGRTVYTPLFSGVFWEVQDTFLPDIERIEVIRGPGSTMWGANSVHGIINIVTRSARKTQGGLATAGAGTEERAFGAARYGGKLGEEAYYRVYGKTFERDDGYLENRDGHDDWRMQRAGFRIDWNAGVYDTVTLQGDIYDGQAGQLLLEPNLAPPPLFRSLVEDVEMSGANLLARWKRTLGPRSSLQLQTYYDYTEREEIVLEEQRDTFDIDFQHSFALGDDHELIWGLEYRFTTDQLEESRTVAMADTSQDDHLFSFFVQDEITLVPETLSLTLGSRFEHNDYTGFEEQPNARLTWTPTPQRTLWTAVSRAVRTPARLEADVRAFRYFPGAGAILITGNDQYESENLVAYEIGWRQQFSKSLTLDLAAFYNDYEDMQSLEPRPGNPMPLLIENRYDGESYGVELSSTWQVMEWWRFTAAYTFTRIQLHQKSGSNDTVTPGSFEEDYPRNQFSLRSWMDLPHDFEFDVWIRYNDTLGSRVDVDPYLETDVRLGWRATDRLRFDIVGQNLLDSSHREYGQSLVLMTESTEVERSVYGRITWEF